jgi:XTP/dITP diphosphohydrolase
MGHDTSYSIKNTAILDKLQDVPFEKRTARFVCAIALIDPSGKVYFTKGKMEGYIAEKIQGENGFGYDPIFYLKEYGCTSAALTEGQKNAISHRGKAVRAMRDLLEKQEENN